MRIEQYIQMIDCALWEVIENGATLPKTQVVKGVTIVMPITSAEDKAQRRLEVNARSTLMMGIPNEHQLKFNYIKDAKLLLEAVEKRFGRKATTKKTQRNLLKQQYENFTTLSSEMLDQTFDRLQKLVSQLELLDEKLSQEDVNQKLLRSLSPEWNIHAIVWRNKAELETMSMDDLYNNLKLYEPEVKGMSSSRRKLTVNGNETIGFDKSKVECYNCHKRRHFSRECRAPRNHDIKNKESSRRSVPVETSTSIALVSCDGLGRYDWSDQAEERPNYALMAYSSSSSDSEIVNNCKKGLGYENYNAVLPPYTRNFMPPTPDLSFGLDAFVNEPVVENSKAMSSEEEPKGNPQMDLQDQGVIDSGCSRHMTGNMSYLTDYEEIDGGYVAFGGNPKEGKSQEKLIDESQVLLRVPRKNNMYSVDLKNIVPKGGLTCLFEKATSDESKL
ncbi:ribonuclease H-like domain-containing protein [Tanacetum coccineum]|uniref:Ribonuclease H-like domain-containing protein n=1 Tax=Tanacetum coccineum TaxID=301880 RepID=A0ABQ5DL89_9ASTR